MSSEDYSHEITRQAIARACLALGFKRAEPAALDTMADVMKEYIEKIARTSLRCAESHGRAQPGIQDIFVAFESMKPFKSHWHELRQFAFPDSVALGISTEEKVKDDVQVQVDADSGKGEIDTTTENKDNDEDDNNSSSQGVTLAPGTTKKTQEKSKAAWNQPFPHTVLPFPIRQRLREDAIVPDEKLSKPEYVPAHLPSFPPVHTYHYAGARQKRKGGQKKAKEERKRAKKQKDVELVGSSLEKLEGVM